MKKAARIILLVAGILSVILGLAFSVIEARLLFSGDFSLYAHPALGVWNALFRLLAALLILCAGVLGILMFREKEHRILKIYVYIFAIASFLILNAATAFLKAMPGSVPGYFTVPLSGVGDLYFVGAVLYFLSDNSAKKPSEKENSEAK
jgi:predicted membrane channel-forming protein YqfA (hemolysin III family)